MALPPYSVQQVISRGRQIIARHPGYSMPNRGYDMNAPFYDCSSFQGVINGIMSCPATGGMIAAYTAVGFIHLPFTSDLKKGDVLIHQGEGANGHTAMYEGDGKFMQCWGGHGPGQRGAWGLDRPYWQDILRNPNTGIYIMHWTCTSNPAESF